ncbi:MAG: serine/threonine-protein phosphatase, partial [Woeseia sp.]|nr:serine/threonine-protein phosphatase [Woeseia sp.]
EERVGDVIRENHHLPMSELCQTLIDQTFAFGGNEPQADDITLVLVKRES